MDWYEQTFGVCPHGGIRPYCAECFGSDTREKQALERKTADSEELRRLAADQAAALKGAEDEVARLRTLLAKRRR